MPRVSFIASHFKTKVEYEDWLASSASAAKAADPEDLLHSAMAPLERFAQRVQEAMNAELKPYFDVLAAEFGAGAIPANVQVDLVGEVCNLGLDAVRSGFESVTIENATLCEAIGGDALSRTLDFGDLQVTDLRLTEDRLEEEMEEATLSEDLGMDVEAINELRYMLMRENDSGSLAPSMRRSATSFSAADGGGPQPQQVALPGPGLD